MNKTEIREYKNFDIVLSDKSKYVVLKIKNVRGLETLEKAANEMIDEVKQDFLAQSGVYFLKLSNGMYIGETNNFRARFINHIENREVESITFATYESQLNLLDKEQIEDIESLLLSYAKEFNLNIGEELKNVKPEDRKIRNHIRGKDNEETSNFIWNQILFLNVRDMFAVSKKPIAATQLEYKGEKTIKEPSKNEFGNNVAESKKTTLIKTLKTKKISEGLLEFKDIKNHAYFVDKHNVIFKHLNFSRNIAATYNDEHFPVFNIELAAKCLYLFLYDGVGQKYIEERLLGHQIDGWITSSTLAYFRIPTSGSQKVLKRVFSSQEAKQVILNFVKNNY